MRWVKAPYVWNKKGQVVDCSGQFHLFLVKKEDRHKFTVISHCGAEHYNVAAMGFKGSVPYVQRKMDDFLRPHRHFARCYVDDTIDTGILLRQKITRRILGGLIRRQRHS